MADTFKNLGQSNPANQTLTTLYTVPGATSATVSSIVICNQATTFTKFRVSIAVAGAADTAAQYLYYDVPINGNATFTATVGWTMAATDVLRIYAGSAYLSFNLFGVEVT